MLQLGIYLQPGKTQLMKCHPQGPTSWVRDGRSSAVQTRTFFLFVFLVCVWYAHFPCQISCARLRNSPWNRHGRCEPSSSGLRSTWTSPLFPPTLVGPCGI